MSTLHLEQLRKLAKSAAPELSDWLEAGLYRWEKGEPLERALSLSGTGAKIQRNRALIRAAKILDQNDDLGPWQKAGLLETAIHRFESIKWPALQGTQDRSLAPLQQELFSAFSAGCEMIRTQRKLYELLR